MSNAAAYGRPRGARFANTIDRAFSEITAIREKLMRVRSIRITSITSSIFVAAVLAATNCTGTHETVPTGSGPTQVPDLGSADMASPSPGDNGDAGVTSDGGAAADGGAARLPGDRWVRIKPLGPGSKWALLGYTPAQIIQLVAKLKPDFLDRLTDGPQDPHATLDANGLTVADFLQQIVDAERPGGTFASRVNLVSYDSDPAAWLQMTQALLNLPVTPRPYVLSVDNWVLWLNNGHTPAQGEAIIQALHAQGWKMVQVTQCGVFDMDGYGAYTETCVDPANGWGTTSTLAGSRCRSGRCSITSSRS
jgi:hypothetical protein